MTGKQYTKYYSYTVLLIFLYSFSTVGTFMYVCTYKIHVKFGAKEICVTYHVDRPTCETGDINTIRFGMPYVPSIVNDCREIANQLNRDTLILLFFC